MSLLLPAGGATISALSLPTITGLVAHYDAATVGLTSSDVTSWTDLSGDGHHLVPGDAPLWVADGGSGVENLPVVQFDGAAERLIVSGITAFADPHIYMIMNNVSHTDGDDLILITFSGGSVALQQGPSPEVELANNKNTTTSAPASGTFFLFNSWNDHDDTASFNQINEDTAITGEDNGDSSAAMTGLCVGAQVDGSSGANFEIAELVVYGGAAITPITGSDDAALKAYFTAKYPTALAS